MEKKGEKLEEKEETEKLSLTSDEINFLTNPFREKFMTKFTIGFNKIVLYGNPIVMSNRSELIKSMLEMDREDGEYFLYTRDEILEKSITILWLHINGFLTLTRNLDTSEYFQLLKLANYFIINNRHFLDNCESIVMNNIDENSRKIILENKEIIGNYINNNLSQCSLSFIDFINNEYPEIKTLLQYIPIYFRAPFKRKIIATISKKYIAEDKNYLNSNLCDVGIYIMNPNVKSKDGEDIYYLSSFMYRDIYIEINTCIMKSFDDHIEMICTKIDSVIY